MELSKFKVVITCLTGGIAGVIEYLLGFFNDMIAKLPAEEVAKYAQLAKDIANFVANVACTFITDARKKAAAQATAKAFDELATALLDSKLTKDELDVIIEAIKAAVKAWQEA